MIFLENFLMEGVDIWYDNAVVPGGQTIIEGPTGKGGVFFESIFVNCGMFSDVFDYRVGGVTGKGVADVRR